MKKIILYICVVFLMVSSTVFSVNAETYGDDYPYRNTTVGSEDEWQFYTGYCTSFVAYRLNKVNEVEFTDYYLGVQWGNANHWADAAMRAGIRVDDIPAPGSVAWSGAGYGHVAWVAEVNENNVTIEEYNYNHSNAYNCRKVPANAYRYIHIKDLNTEEGSRCISHIFDAGFMKKQATCTTDGLRIRTCTMCHETKEEVITAEGHAYNIYNKCTKCGAYAMNVSSAVAAIKISSVSRSKGALTVKWKKNSKVKGYQIRYSTQSNMTNAKSSRITKYKTTKKKITKLKKKTTYYLQIRAYKTIGGKTKYSPWSSVKRAKTK